MSVEKTQAVIIEKKKDGTFSSKTTYTDVRRSMCKYIWHKISIFLAGLLAP